MTFPSPPGSNNHLTTSRPGGPPLWPEPEPEPESRFPEGLLIGAVVVLAAIIVGGALFGWTRWRSGDDEATAVEATDEGTDPSLSPTTSEPAATDETDQTPRDESLPDETTPSTEAPPVQHVTCPSDAPDRVCAAAEFVEDFRGRPFKQFPNVELVDDESFADRLLRDFEDAREELAISTEVWRSLGFIDSGTDLFDALAASYELGAVGVYFTDTKELYIQGTELDLYAELVIVHELTHAHDDQWLDLDRQEYEDATDEIGYGFSALTEGNARRVENAWRSELSGSEEAELQQLESSVLSPEEIEAYLSLPALLLQFQISPYQDGLVLVDDLAARGGEQAVDDAFGDPPTTSEQVRHPELFATREEAVEVAPPPAEGEIVDEGLVGELAFDLWWSDAVGDGWGGDYYVSWLTDSGACTRFDVVGDTPADTDEFRQAAERWAGEDDGRTVEAVDGLIRVTGCY